MSAHHRRPGARPMLMALLALWTASMPAAEKVLDRSAVVREIGLGEARWTSGFWFERVENVRTNLLPDMVRLMEGTNVSQYLENFRIAAGLVEGRPTTWG